MPVLPILSGKEIIKLLTKLGYRVVRQRGSHIRLERPGRKSVTVPNYNEIDRSLLHKILRDAEVAPEELEELLQ